MSRDIDFTQPLSSDDAVYVQHRPWLLRDAELAGIEVTYEDDKFVQEDADEADEIEDDEDGDEDYSKLSVKELKAEIEARNEQYDEDEQIEVEEPGNKPELIAALTADDAKSDQQ